MRFSEFFVLYDYLKFYPNQSNKYRINIQKRLDKYKNVLDDKGQPIYNADYEDLKRILFEVSAFMQTNAQVDFYRQETFDYLRDITEKRKQNDFNDTTRRSFSEVYKEIENAKLKNDINESQKKLLQEEMDKLIKEKTNDPAYISKILQRLCLILLMNIDLRQLKL
jgi:hypothetical protein